MQGSRVKEKRNDSGCEISIFKNRRLDSVKRNFAIGAQRIGLPQSAGKESSCIKKQISKN